MTESDPFSPANWKALCAQLGIEVTTVTDAFGRTDIRIDRPGMERIRDSALLVGELELAEFFDHCLNAGGQS